MSEKRAFELHGYVLSDWVILEILESFEEGFSISRVILGSS